MSRHLSTFSTPSFSALSPHSSFNLPKKEWIFEKFSCTLWSKIFIPGYIFCSEHHICFLGETFGHETKIVIPFTDIQQIKKSQSLGAHSDSVEVHTKSGKDYHFTGFIDFDKAYELITALYQRTASCAESDHNASLDTLDGNRTRVGSSDNPVEYHGKIVDYEPDKNKQPPETIKVGLPISMERFFELFFADEAPFSLAQAMELGGASEVQLTNWRPGQEENTLIKEMTMIVKVKGVPFKSKARVQAVLTCKKKSSEIEVRIVKKTLDVPYADAFQVEEKWHVQPEEGHSGRCLLTNTVEVVFSKSLSVEKIIRNRTYESVKAEHDLWLQNAQNKQYIVESENSVNTPLLTPTKGSIVEEEKDAHQNQPANNTEVAKEVEVKTESKGLRPIIILLVALIMFLILSIMVLYSKLNRLEERFEMLERTLYRNAFDSNYEF